MSVDNKQRVEFNLMDEKPSNINEKLLASLIHISDLHFCDKFTNDESTVKQYLSNIPKLQGAMAHSYQAAGSLSIRVNQILNDRKDNKIPAGVVFTGDLSRRGEI
jgi:hypothetical protein